jgi:hypothetical protein
MRPLALGSVLLAAVALTPVHSVGQERSSVPPLVRLQDARGSDRLLRLQPLTLRPLGRSIRTFHSGAWTAFSPDGRTMAISDGAGDRSRIQFVDLAGWRSLGTVRLGRRGTLALGWVSDDRVLAVPAWDTGRRQALVVDTKRGEIVARHAVSGQLIHGIPVPGGHALLLSPRRGIGPARIVIVDASGAARTVELEGIEAGGADREPHGEELIPGITADPDAGRLYAIAARRLLVAEIELGSGAVSYHALAAPAGSSKLATAAKGNIDMWWRQAAWVGDGRFAVTGEHYPPARRNRPPRRVPFGVRLVDTRDWSITTLDARPDVMRVAGGTLLATGTRWFYDGRPPKSTGLLAFDAQGRRLFTRFRDRDATVAGTRGDLAYVWVRRTHTVHVIDVRDGHTVKEVRTLRHVPFLLTP